MRRIVLGLIAVLASLTVLVATMSAAQAAQVNDPHDAPWPYDARSLAKWTNQNGYVVVGFGSPSFRVGGRFNGLTVRLDTRGDSYGDYLVDWSFGGDGDGYSAFALVRNGTTVSCPDLTTATKHSNGWMFIYVEIPRYCMTITKTIRVRGQTWDYTSYAADGHPTRGATDNVPNAGRWF
ncbi:hypothetical protein [Nocardioides ultimimeridianus]